MKPDSGDKDDQAATSTASGVACKDISGHDPVAQEIEHHAKRHVDGTTQWLNFSIEKKNLRYKVEAIGESNASVIIYAVSHRLHMTSHGLFI